MSLEIDVRLKKGLSFEELIAFLNERIRELNHSKDLTVALSRIEENFLIDDAETGELVPFIFRPVQARYYDILCKDYNKGEPEGFLFLIYVRRCNESIVRPDAGCIIHYCICDKETGDIKGFEIERKMWQLENPWGAIMPYLLSFYLIERCGGDVCLDRDDYMKLYVYDETKGVWRIKLNKVAIRSLIETGFISAHPDLTEEERNATYTTKELKDSLLKDEYDFHGRINRFIKDRGFEKGFLGTIDPIDKGV